MGKFRDIIQGARARKLVEVIALDGVTPIKCAVRILMPEDDADIEEAAVEFAKSHKVANPTPGNTQYERGLMLHALLRACLDPDVTDKDEPFFESAAQIGKYLDDARALHLYFQQRAFQKEVSPNPKKGQDPETYLRLVFESVQAEARGDDPALPFVSLPYGTLVSFAVESVRLLSSPRPSASDIGSSSPDEQPSSASTATH